MTILDIQMFIVMMSHWWTPSNWLFALTPGEYQKSTISQGGGGAVYIFYFYIYFETKMCSRAHCTLYYFRTRNKELLKVQTKMIKEY